MVSDTFLQENYKEIFSKYKWLLIIGALVLIFAFALIFKGFSG